MIPIKCIPVHVFDGVLFVQSRLHHTKKAAGCSFSCCLEHIKFGLRLLLLVLQFFDYCLKVLDFRTKFLVLVSIMTKFNPLTFLVFSFILLMARLRLAAFLFQKGNAH